jgi:hypothetical protein
MIKNGIKRIRKNIINEKPIKAENFIRSIILLIMLDTLLLRPSLHFTILHPTTLHSTSLHLSTLHFLLFKLNPLHFTTLSFGLTPFKSPTAPVHLTSLHTAIVSGHSFVP